MWNDLNRSMRPHNPPTPNPPTPTADGRRSRSRHHRWSWIAFALLWTLAMAPATVAGPSIPDLPETPGDEARLLRYPDIHRDFVIFVYGGDLWRADSSGGEARRLTRHQGLELFPKISPDGQWIAFSAEYSGSRQVWVMPAEGGEPRQLTHYVFPGSMPPRGGYDYWIQGWTPDGKVLVRANQTPHGRRVGTLWAVDPAGGLPQPLEIAESGSASLSPDGSRIAYTPISREFRTWKRTVGGRAQDLWLYDFDARQSTRLTDFEGTDNFPLWASEDRIYFTSDRSRTLNLFVLDPAGGEARQVTDYQTFDVLWPSLGPESIVFTKGGWLYRMDLATEAVERIPLSINAAFPDTVPTWKPVEEFIEGSALAPGGRRALFAARGELLSVPAKHGPVRNLSTAPESRERAPAWSPDGSTVAFVSDRSGEQEIWLSSGRSEETRQLTEGGDVWIYQPIWSPTGDHLAYADRNRRLRIVAVASGEITTVDRGREGDLEDYSFSPDGRWLVYETTHPETALPAVAIYGLGGEAGEATGPLVLGDGLSNDYDPAWSADGLTVFFVSDRNYNWTFSEFETNYVYTDAARIYAAALTADAPALFPQRSDEVEVAAAEAEPAAEGESAAEGEEASGLSAANLDVDAFVSRTIALPGIAPGQYADLQQLGGHLFFSTFGASGAPALFRYDLEAREAVSLGSDLFGYSISPDGQHLLYTKGQGWAIAGTQSAITDGQGTLDLADLRLKIDPRQEWRQMWLDGWRIARDWFYDPAIHGLDWKALGERYGEMLPHVTRRDELDWLFGELIGELEVGHAYVGRGDEPEVEAVSGGKLGARLELGDGGRYRLAEIYQGEGWDARYRSPLQEPGVQAAVGDYLLAIDGEPLEAPDDPYRLLEGKADRTVELTLASSPGGGDARSVLVHTLGSEQSLRYIDWIKQRMRIVDELSDGRIGYIHLPNTAGDGNRMLQKLFYGQVRKEALIIDDRYNGGGLIPDRMIEVLARRSLSRWAGNRVEPFHTPDFAHDGPKAMLINGYSSSGGDALPYYFRKLGLGPLIGTRTWGGLIGLEGNPDLVDGGNIAAPHFRIFDENGEWVVENEGVAPDIEVYDLNEHRLDGRDPSIEKAVEVLLETLETNPPHRWVQPPPLVSPSAPQGQQ
ncbi:MAG: PDZ domain-containing protein [Acidobacteriota bacterium]